MRTLPRLLVTTAIVASVSISSLPQPVMAQERGTLRVSDNAGSGIAIGGVLLLLLAGLAAAGGGGSDTTTTPPGPTPPTPNPPGPGYAPPGGYAGDLRPRYVIGVTPFDGTPRLSPIEGDANFFDTPEYRFNRGLPAINAANRYAQGALGEGTLVAVFDSGARMNHSDLSGNINADLSHTYFNEATPEDITGHGTHVAGIIGAVRNGSGMHGVAPLTQLMILQGLDRPGSSMSMPFFRAWEDSMLRSVEAGADVINHSWSFIDGDENPLRITEIGSRQDAFAFFGADVMNTMAYTAQQDLISVYSAGNGSGGESSVTAALPVYFEEIRDHWVSVVALNADDTIADYSSHCGIAMNYCLAAPGTSITSTSANGNYENRSGTSMAAGFVSGSIALLKSNFPEITGATALQILKDTARDLGAPGIDAIYGHGAIDLSVAMAPVGPVSVQMTDRINERTSSLSETNIMAPVGVSNALFSALSASTMSVTDGYNRSFAIPMGAVVGEMKQNSDLASLNRFAMRGRAAGLSGESGTFISRGAPVSEGAAMMPDALSFGAGHAGILGEDALALTHFEDIGSGFRLGVTGAASINGTSDKGYGSLTLSADLGTSVLSLEAGRLAESGGFLGADFSGAFGGVSGQTDFIRMTADIPLTASTGFHFNASTGQTHANGTGLITGGKIRSESFGVGFSRKNTQTGSVLSIGVSSPVSISGGSLNMRVPVGVAAASNGVASQEVLVQSLTANLGGSSAPMDLQMGYEIPVGNARFGMGVSHRSGSRGFDGTSASIGMSLKF